VYEPWGLSGLDLDAYLGKVGVPARPPGLEALAELQTAHVRTFPFENLDVLLRRHPGVALSVVEEKFVGRGRGGYCFEHVTLFAAVLERLGYDAVRHLGRVGDVRTVARTHAVVLVTLDDQRYLVDPGFGMSVTRPVPLADGVEVDDAGWRYRVRRTDNGEAGSVWELHRLREEGWEMMHATDELPVVPVDLVMSHHYTSTFPGSHFTTGLILAKYLPARHVTVTATTVTVRRAGRPTEHRPLAAGELLERFVELGVTLPPDKVDEVMTLLPTLRS
jgi:N-hydroxyarylamine O-acetyltransferase